MTNILRDVRYGGRMLAKHPGHTVAALLALGLGIGLTTTVFSIDYGALLRGLPFERADRIMAVYATKLSQQQDRRDVFPLDYLDLRRRQTSFESLAAYGNGTINLSGDLQPERFDGAFLTADGLGVLRVRPLLGRGFLPGEDAPQAEPVVIIGYGIWRTRYGGDPKVIGRAVRVNGQPATIVGVMPAGFKFPERQDVWVPKKIDPGKLKRRDEGDGVQLFGRLKEGVTPERAQIELAAFAKAIEKDYPQTNRGVGVEVVPFAKSFLGAKETNLLLVMLGFGFVVLFIACANVASLMVAKASLRTRELAIRSALGAGRRRVVVQLLVESTLLSLGGAVLGVVLAAWGVGLFNAAIYSNPDNAPPFWIRCEVDGVALAFTLGITVLAGVLSGLLPALQASRADLNEILKDEGRGSTSLRIGLFSRFLVISELAVCCMLLVGAGLMVKSVVKLQNLNLGFSTQDVLTLRIALFEAKYPQKTDRAAFFDELLRRLSQQPGVAAAGATSTLPTNGAWRDFYTVEGRAYPREQDLPEGYEVVASPGYFQVFATPLVAGRLFGPEDRPGSLPVALVNQSFASKAWPKEDPLGRRVRLGRGKAEEPWRTVVGVVADQKVGNLDDVKNGPESLYVPLAQDTPGFVSVALRSRGEPLALAPKVREQIAAVDKDLPIYWVKSMEQVVAANAFYHNLFGVVFTILGLAALILAAVGIYGVISFAVQQRTQEIGVRMALGAGRGNVLVMILRQGAVQLGVGLGAGLLLALGASRPLQTLLYQVEPTDPATFLTVALVLSAVAMAASLVPAQRAAQVDPLVAIRSE